MGFSSARKIDITEYLQGACVSDSGVRVSVTCL